MKKRTRINKRVFFGGFSMKHLQEALTRHLDQYEYDFVGHVSLRNYLKHPEVTFFLQRDCYRKPNFIENPDDSLPPPEIIEHMKFAEVTCLKMMDRNHKSPFPHHRYENRKRVYLAQLTLAYSILSHHRIEHVFFSILPHNTFDYILHHLARHLGIRSEFVYQTQIVDTFFLTSEVEDLYQEIPETGQLNQAPLPAHLEAEIESRINKTKPFYMSNEGLSWKEIIYIQQKRIFRINTYIQPLYALKSYLTYKRLPKLTEPPSQRYIYFALHFQPEATTSPMGGVYVDQHLAILTLARSVPDDMVIVIKEHPTQFFWQRYPELYEILNRQKNVVFAEKSVDSHLLTEKSFAVATITGTVGWEAIFASKPVLLFGNLFCEKIKGVSRVGSRKDIQEAIKQVENGDFPHASPEEIHDFMHRLQSVTHTGVVDVDYFRNSAVTTEYSIEKVAELLEKNVAESHEQV
ncbi:MAG: hypothetical protein QNL68_13720 [Akkermansiaceae bacterium]